MPQQCFCYEAQIKYDKKFVFHFKFFWIQLIYFRLLLPEYDNKLSEPVGSLFFQNLRRYNVRGTFPIIFYPIIKTNKDKSWPRKIFHDLFHWKKLNIWLVSGSMLKIRPNAREISRLILSSRKSVQHRKFNALLMQWGQYLIHEMAKTTLVPSAKCNVCQDIPGRCMVVPIQSKDPNKKHVFLAYFFNLRIFLN